MAEPTRSLLITWCPVCGRNDRWQSISKTKHWARGEVCPGVLVQLQYVLQEG